MLSFKQWLIREGNHRTPTQKTRSSEQEVKYQQLVEQVRQQMNKSLSD